MLVTHSLETVNEFADRALLLMNGRVQACGCPNEIIEGYRHQVATQAEHPAQA